MSSSTAVGRVLFAAFAFAAPAAVLGDEAPVTPPAPDQHLGQVTEYLAVFRRDLPEECERAREAIRSAGKEILPSLRALEAGKLATPVRANFCWVYGVLGDASAADLLAPRLEDPDTEVRVEACRALGKLKILDQAGKLKEFLKDGNSRVREAAAFGLGRMGDHSAAEALAALLVDLRGQAGPVRAAAAEALGGLEAASARGPLVMALRDPDVRVRRAALGGLARLTGGMDRAYDPDASEPDREPAVKSWEEWLSEQH